MGEKLANRIKQVHPNHEIDVVIPIPDTSRTSALQAAYYLNRPFREGFIKNRYIARTFIMPGQETRGKSVRLKLNTIKSEFGRMSCWWTIHCVGHDGARNCAHGAMWAPKGVFQQCGTADSVSQHLWH
jgi:hypothetical protein